MERAPCGPRLCTAATVATSCKATAHVAASLEGCGLAAHQSAHVRKKHKIRIYFIEKCEFLFQVFIWFLFLYFGRCCVPPAFKPREWAGSSDGHRPRLLGQVQMSRRTPTGRPVYQSLSTGQAVVRPGAVLCLYVASHTTDHMTGQ